MKKDEYPKKIADELGIPPIEGKGGPWMSTEGTVLVDWLAAVGEALDIQYSGEKTRMMRKLVEAVGEEWDERVMTSRLTNSQGGGNIQTPAFAALLRGLESQPTARRRAVSNENRGEFKASATPGAADDRVAMRAIKVRAGQPQFRAGLLAQYEGMCAVSETNAPPALEAAHVLPYGLGGTYELKNGILLRGDIHTLFDLGLLGFDEHRKVIVSRELNETPYAAYVGTRLREPKSRVHRVNDQDLKLHRDRAGLD